MVEPARLPRRVFGVAGERLDAPFEHFAGRGAYLGEGGDAIAGGAVPPGTRTPLISLEISKLVRFHKSAHDPTK
jgi:hypothetical protein